MNAKHLASESRYDWSHPLTWSCLAGVILLTALVYVEVPQAGFVYDDGTFIVNNPTLRTMQPYSKFFFNRKAYSADGRFAIYRPLPALSYAIDYQISYARDRWEGRQNPKGIPDSTVFHISNILGHMVNAALVFVLLLALFGNIPAATLGALVFAFHPLNSESVSWISRRGNVFFLTFALVALCLHVRMRRTSSEKGALSILVVVCYALSLLSQELAIVLPGLLLVYDVLLVPQTRRKASQLFFHYIPFAVTAVLYLYLRHTVLGKTAQQGYHGDSFFITMLTMTRVFVTYLRQLFVPTGLSANYFVTLSKSLLEWQVLASIGVLSALAASAVLLWRRVPLVSFCLAWFFITLGPVSNVVPLQALQNDRFLYMTTVGLAIGLAGLYVWSMNRAGVRKVNRVSIVLGLALTMMAATFAMTTFLHNRVWHSNFTLWNAAVKVQPHSAIARTNLGKCYEEQGNMEKAIEHWKVALKTGDKPYVTANNLAVVYMKQRKYREAEEMARLAVEYAPEKYMTHFLLGNILNDTGRTREAEVEYQKALGTQGAPRQKYTAHVTLARIYIGLARTPEQLGKVLYHAEKAWNLNPDADVGLTMVIALRVNKRTDDAKRLALNLLRRIPPSHPLREGFEQELRRMGVNPNR